MTSRVRAVEVLVEIFGGLPADHIEQIAQSKAPEIRARTAWALSRGEHSSAATQVLARMTNDADPRVTRAAWEALATSSEIGPAPLAQPDWTLGLMSDVRRVRAAAISVAQGSRHC